MIDHIVFDVGRVLVHWDPERPYRHLIPDPARRAWFLANVCTPAWNEEQDRGRTFAEGEAVLIAKFPEEADLIRAYRKNWHEMVPHTLPETPDILSALVAAGHDVTLLTNFNQDTFAEAKRRFPVLTQPRGATVSGEVGLIKPDPKIYAHHTETFALNPSRTFFVDDTKANITAAQAAGWDAVLYTDPATFRADLRARHIDFETKPAAGA
ncbi:MAG: HAD family phosphatase [Pseudomonadota bacterium]